MADTAVTLPNKFKSENGIETQAALGGYNRVYQIDYTLVDNGTGSSDTETVTLDSTAGAGWVDKATVWVETAFDGTTGGFTIQVGTDADPDAFIAATDVKTPGGINEGGALATAANSSWTASDNLVARFTNATNGSPSDLTAGRVWVLLNVIEAGDITKSPTTPNT